MCSVQCALYKVNYIFVIRYKLSYEYTLIKCRTSYINSIRCKCTLYTVQCKLYTQFTLLMLHNTLLI